MDLKCTNKESPEEVGSPLAPVWSLGCPSCCLYSRICGLQKLRVRAMVGRGRCWGHSVTMAVPGQEPMVLVSPAAGAGLHHLPAVPLPGHGRLCGGAAAGERGAAAHRQAQPAAGSLPLTAPQPPLLLSTQELGGGGELVGQHP